MPAKQPSKIPAAPVFGQPIPLLGTLDAWRAFGSSELLRLFGRDGLTLRNLQWWDEKGLLVPEHKWHSRRYSREDVVMIGLILRFRRRGVSLQMIRKIIRQVKGKIAAHKKTGPVKESPFAEYIVLNSESKETAPAKFFNEPEQLVMFLCFDSRSPVAVVSLGEIVRQVEGLNR